jgi:hypothetical protein
MLGMESRKRDLAQSGYSGSRPPFSYARDPALHLWSVPITWWPGGRL